MGRAIGILGFGTIGRQLLTSIRERTVSASTVRIFDRHPDRVESSIDPASPANVVAVRSFDRLVDVDLVVEAAGQGAVREYAVDILRAGCDLVTLSVGALADRTLREQVIETAEQTGQTVFVPSGAIAGLDAITAAGNSDLESVSLTTTKPPNGIAGAPYLDSHGIDVHEITEPTTVFEGSATEAAEGFPSNINVALALSLAGVGPERTTVRIVADPDGQRNVHRIAVSGAMGDIETTVRNDPSPTNPKTSYLAVLSAIELLRDDRTVQVGT
ncbi:aspartate dehydrogenase [Halocatena salina]|uniref:L-aspartate dehydrogenase n=1 Tax=Halocatena salina TaxID=2934340 RepID=A0A8U0A549_9EURY|nr:aspartate dehydrogenase [Halocatena salina]UPM44331.1 aspartate dehydrogenase [Halocatena salina]